MKLLVHERQTQYELNLLRFTQLCGTDFRKKRYIVKSLKKYFSSSKYMEYEEYMADNIRIDEEIPGREYFDLYAVGSSEDLLKMIEMGKTTLMSQYIKMSLQSDIVKNEMKQLEILTEIIYDKLNESIFHDLCHIQLSYSIEKLFDIIQKSELLSSEMNNIKSLSDYELIRSFLFLAEQIQKKNPRKMMIIFENIDHLIGYEEFQEITEYIFLMCRKYDMWFIFSMSTEKYVCLEDEYFEGINIVNDEIFALSKPEYLYAFIDREYPCNMEYSNEEIMRILKSVIHKIGDPSAEIEQKGDVLLKMINRTLCIDTKVRSTLNNPEKSYLKTKL